MLNSTECAVSPDPVVHHTKVVWYTAHKKIKKKKTTFPLFSPLHIQEKHCCPTHKGGWERGWKAETDHPDSQNPEATETESQDISYLCCSPHFMNTEADVREREDLSMITWPALFRARRLEHTFPDSKSGPGVCFERGRWGVQREKRTRNLSFPKTLAIPGPKHTESILYTQITRHL